MTSWLCPTCSLFWMINPMLTHMNNRKELVLDVGFLCGAYVWTVQRKGRAWIVDQGKTFFLSVFSECCTFSRCWIGGLRVCVPTQREERHKGHSGNRSFLAQRFLTQMGRTVFTVAVASSLQDSVFICFVQLWSRVLIAKIEYSF